MGGVGMEEAGEATIITPKVAVEDMKEEAEEDMETEEAEEEAPEEGRCREAGEMEEGEVVTIRATIMMLEVIRGEEGEGVMEEGTIREASRTLATMEEEEAAVVIMTVTTKTEIGTKREVGVEEVGGAGEEEVEEDKEEAGEGEGDKILIKEDSLSSSSNMVGSTTTKLALIKADTTLVEDTVWGIAAESTQRLTAYIQIQILNALPFRIFREVKS